MSSPDSAVAARQRTSQLAALVDQRDRHAVDLQFDDPFERLARQQFRDTLAVLAQLLDAVGVVDRQHRDAVLDLLQIRHRLIADPLRRAVGRDQLRMLPLPVL